MSPYLVRKAEPDDAAAFAECHAICFREAYRDLWGPERLADIDPEELAHERRAEIEAGAAEHAMAIEDDQVIGIAIVGPTRDEEPATDTEVYAVYVRKNHHGTGVADDLLDAALGSGPASLWVYRDNPRAAAFYVHHDFIPDGNERHDPYGILEIRMVRR